MLIGTMLSGMRIGTLEHGNLNNHGNMTKCRLLASPHGENESNKSLLVRNESGQGVKTDEVIQGIV